MSKYLALGCLLAVPLSARADVGDPQVGTDHPWYPGELSCSTFDRLFATQAALYKRAAGRDVATDEDKALASWYWRNLNYWHGEEGAENLWGAGFTAGGAMETRDYWTGLFAHGFGLCGTTHCQWAAEFQRLLGHNRSRAAGVPGHSSHEVYLTGGPYGAGKWVLLDHDIGTVVFTADGAALASIPELRDDLRRLSRRDFNPRRQRGWPMWSYFDGHWKAFGRHESVAYLAGYAGPPPVVHLRRGETLRRYLEPGLDDGKTFVFWGRNYMTGASPARSGGGRG